MWLMLQQDKPDDYVIATGRTTSVRDMVGMAFAHVGLELTITSSSIRNTCRPAEVEVLLGDATKARQELGWTPTISLEEIIAEMVDAELKRHRASGR